MSLLARDQIVEDHNQGKYRVDGYLDEGATAEVYRAVRLADNALVALKVLRPGLPEVIRESFWSERATLAALFLKGNELPYVPRVWNWREAGPQSSQANPDFIVMELLIGQPVTRLLEKGALAEIEALTIAAQVLQVLQVLHRQLRQTYIDFQLQNIWWHAQTQTVKVIDFNHVSAPAAEGNLPSDWGAADLVRFGAYLYQMLTGKGASQRGETVAALSARAGRLWTDLSLGTRLIVQRSLHPAPRRRYSQVEVFDGAVDAQLRGWDANTDPLELIDQARLAIRGLKGDALLNALEPVERAQALLDLAERRGADPAEVGPARRRLPHWSEDVSVPWGAGREHYKLGQYAGARERWEAEAQAQGRPDLWRWVLVAGAASQLGKTLFDPTIKVPLEEALDQMAGGQWETAHQTLLLAQARGASGPDFAALQAEALAQLAARQAEAAETRQTPDQLEAAAGHVGKLAKQLELLPEQFKALVVEQQGWEQLDQRAEQFQQRAHALRARSARLTRLAQALSSNLEGGLLQLRDEFIAQPADSELEAFCGGQADALHQRHDLAAATAVLAVAIHFAQGGRDAPALRQTWQALLAEQRAAEFESRFLKWADDFDAAGKLEGLAEAAPATLQPRLIEILLPRFEDAQLNHRRVQAEALGRALDRLDPNGAAGRTAALARDQARRATEQKDWRKLPELAERLALDDAADFVGHWRQRFTEKLDQRLFAAADYLAGALAIVDPAGNSRRSDALTALRTELAHARATWEQGARQALKDAAANGKYTDGLALAKRCLAEAPDASQDFLVAVDDARNFFETAIYIANNPFSKVADDFPASNVTTGSETVSEPGLRLVQSTAETLSAARGGPKAEEVSSKRPPADSSAAAPLVDSRSRPVEPEEEEDRGIVLQAGPTAPVSTEREPVAQWTADTTRPIGEMPIQGIEPAETRNLASRAAPEVRAPVVAPESPVASAGVVGANASVPAGVDPTVSHPEPAPGLIRSGTDTALIALSGAKDHDMRGVPPVGPQTSPASELHVSDQSVGMSKNSLPASLAAATVPHKSPLISEPGASPALPPTELPPASESSSEPPAAGSAGGASEDPEK